VKGQKRIRIRIRSVQRKDNKKKGQHGRRPGKWIPARLLWHNALTSAASHCPHLLMEGLTPPTKATPSGAHRLALTL
jgi:hypothetical protein